MESEVQSGELLYSPLVTMPTPMGALMLPVIAGGLA